MAAGSAGPSQELFPQDPETQRLYAEGLSKLRLLDAAAAVPILQAAAARDAQSPLIRSALAEGWAVLGFKLKAKSEARRAFEGAKGLPPERLIEIEANYRELATEWSRAIEIHRSLWTVFPDDIEYGLKLANDQIAVGNGQEALATLTRLRKVPGFTVDPRIDLTEAAAAEALGDFQHEYRAAQQAVADANTSGARLFSG